MELEQDLQMENESEPNEELSKLKGRYISALGRRKSSIALVRLYKKGNGTIIVNNKNINQYFSQDKAMEVKKILKNIGIRDINLSVVVKGGGSRGQSEAIKLGIARVFIKYDENLKPVLKTKGLLTRDARIKERKKPGLKKARRAPQWSKR